MNLTTLEILVFIPDKDTLLLADALLFAVYGWTPDKVKKMKLSSIERWIGHAKNRMSWGDAYKLRVMLQPKDSIWKRIFSKKNY